MTIHSRTRRLAAATLLVLCACQTPPPAGAPPPVPATLLPTARPGPAPPPASAAPQATPRETPAAAGTPRPAWLGTRVLPRRPDGFGEVRATPRLLRDRRLVTVDHLPPPTAPGFAAAVRRVPRDVVRRSTWSAACPVGLSALRYVTVTFWGFDGRRHTGELLVHARAARDVVTVFRRLHRARFPIEEMRVVRRAELDAPPTGDGNNTTAFVCRPARGSTRWSQHAYGLAIDVNPFHNPYLRDDLVLPELASAYADRRHRRPGMIRAGGVVVEGFDAIGWGWGGRWTRPRDFMHFSADGT